MSSISQATTEDLPTVQRLAHTIWHQHYPGILGRDQIDYMLERGYSVEALQRFVGEPGAGLLLANVDGVSVGFAAWCRTDKRATSKLDKLYVLGPCQRQGIGRRLLERVAEAAFADGARTLILNVNKHNVGSIAAYQQCGFVIREAVVVDIGQGYAMDDYLMAKSL